MNDKIPAFEVPAEIREMAERSVEQARKAMDGFVTAAGKAFDTIDGSANTAGASMKDMRAKSFAYAEKSLQAAFDHAQKLVRAKDPTEAMRLQAEFMQAQFEEMRKQMTEFGAAAQAGVEQAAKDVAKEASKAVAPKK